jgi:hypothetical protein
MTTKLHTTRREVASDLNFNLSHIKRSLQNDVDQITALIEAIEIWTDKDPIEPYNGEVAGRIYDLLSVTNNSGWISYLEAAIRCASIKKGNF